MNNRPVYSNPKQPGDPLSIRFLRWFCDTKLVDSIEGDLLELYEENTQLKGVKKARLQLMWEVIKLFRPTLIKGLKTQTMTPLRLIQNFLLTTYRGARKEKSFTFLNILCLTIGFMICLYVGTFIMHEFSYDHFHDKADRIYRINQTFIWGGTDKLFGSTGPAVMNAIESEVPEFEVMTRVHTYENAWVSKSEGDDAFIYQEGQIRAADSTFFKVFSFPLLKGNPKTALVEPFSIVVTESIARKYFDTDDVLGRQLIIDDEDKKHTYKITGVAKDIPSNSHITFDLLISMSSIERLKWQNDSWWWTTFVTFGVLRPDADPEQVAKKVAQVPGKYLEAFLMKYKGMTYQEFIESGEEWDLFIQPLLDIHLFSSHVISRLNNVGHIQTIYSFGIIAIMILLLSIINFINLTTARSARRGKEVGVRKVMGSNHSELIIHFIMESVLYCLVALGFSLVALGIIGPYLNWLSGNNISVSTIYEPAIFITILFIAILTGILAGIYPAFYLSAFNPLKVLKGHLLRGTKGTQVRNILVTIQFTVSIALIACAYIVNNQVNFFMSYDMGFDRENIIIIRNAERLGNSMKNFQHELLTNPLIEQVAIASDNPPYTNDSDGNFFIKGKDLNNELSYWVTDEYFVDIYNLNILAGSNFSKDKDNSNTVIVSEAVMKAFGFTKPEDIVGEQLTYDGYECRIIGVIEDIETAIWFWDDGPLAIFYDGFFVPRPYREIAVKYRSGLSPDKTVELMESIESKWASFDSGVALNSYFLDQHFQMEFEDIIHFSRQMNFYSLLAIIIAGLGLTGLVAYVIERRNKEIGIRKVLGASIASIWFLLTRDFGKLLIIGFILATIISWYLGREWVAGYKFQAPITVLPFILSGVLMLVVAVVTLSFQVIRAARINPVAYLRDE